MQSLPITRSAHPSHLSQTARGPRVRSRTGVLGAVAVLLAVPVEVLSQVLALPAGIFVHAFLAAGVVLVGVAAFDFGLPRWLAVAGAVVAVALGVIFLLQALTELTQSEPLRGVAYGVLGGAPEGGLGLLVAAWFVAPLVLVTRGTLRLVGWCVLPLVLAFDALRLIPGVSILPEVPTILVWIVPFAWFLAASAQRPERA